MKPKKQQSQDKVPAKKKKKSASKTAPRMVLQGYDFTTARYRCNLYQKRMLISVVGAAQGIIAGERNIAGRNIKVEEGDYPIISIPLSVILQDEESSNIFAVRNAAKELIKRVVEYQTVDGNWIAFAPFITANVPRYGSELKLQVHKLFWEAILDYRSGYRKFDAKQALALRSVYAIRFYELFSGKKDPIVYTIDKLKDMFDIKDKYSLTADFVRYVLEPAKRELDSSSPWSFNFEPVKESRKIVAFRFTPVHYSSRDCTESTERDLLRRTALSWDIADRNVRNYLKESMGFTEVEIKNNIEVFRRAAELLPDPLGTLADLKGRSRDKDNPKGWIIRSLEGKVRDMLDKIDSDPGSPEVQALARKLDAK